VQLTLQPGQSAPSGTPAGPDGPPARARLNPGRLALVIAAIWLVTVLAYVAGAAIVLPLVVLVATASLLRGGNSLLDRLMLAVAVLLGLTCVAGLLFAVWPWHLHPVPITGTALTALALLAQLTGRRPTLPRPRIADVVAGGAAALVTAYVAWPLLRMSQLERLGFVVASEDVSRHMNIVDTIRQTGGFLFMHPATAEQQIYTGMIRYPQGSHLFAALLDNYLLSSTTDFGTMLQVMDRYLAFEVLNFGLLILALAWAVQWLAGAALSPGRRLVLVAFVTAVAATGDLMYLLVASYASEVLGLTEMVLLTALIARPVSRMRQQLLLMAALIIAVGFTYYLFLPAGGLAILMFLFRYRHRLRRHRAALAVTAVVTAPLAVMPIVLGLTVGKQTVSLFEAGDVHPSRDYLLAFAAAVLAGLIGPRARGTRRWWGYAASVAAAAVLAGAFFAAVSALSHQNSYFANKTLHLVFVELLIGVGVLTLYLPAPATRRLRLTRADLGRLAPALLGVVAVGAAFSMVTGDSPYRPQRTKSNWAVAWMERARRNDPLAIDVYATLRHDAGRPAVPTLVMNDNPVDSYTRSLFLSTFERTAGKTAPGMYSGVGLDDPRRAEVYVTNIAGPVRIIAESDAAEAAAREIAARHPEQPIEVVRKTW